MTNAETEMRVAIYVEGRVYRDYDGYEVEDMAVYAVGRDGQRVVLPPDWLPPEDYKALAECLIDNHREARQGGGL